MAIYGLGRHFLNRTSRLVRWASEIAYPFYIVHQTVIVVIAFYVVQWQAGIMPKYLAISTASLAVCVLLCELIKRTNLTRFLFGMKPKGHV